MIVAVTLDQRGLIVFCILRVAPGSGVDVSYVLVCCTHRRTL